MLRYIKTAQGRLSTLQSATTRQNEAGWFLKIAWNLALQCDDSYQEMSNFFTACYELSSHVQVDSSVLQRQKTCQLMAAAASLQLAKTTISDEEKVRLIYHYRYFVLSTVSPNLCLASNSGIRLLLHRNNLEGVHVVYSTCFFFRLEYWSLYWKMLGLAAQYAERLE